MKRIYALLNADQQADFDQRIEAIRDQQMEQQLRRRLAAAGVDPNSMPAIKIGPDGRPQFDESQLSPEQRQRLQRLREQRRRMIERMQEANPTPPSPDDIKFDKPQH